MSVRIERVGTMLVATKTASGYAAVQALRHEAAILEAARLPGVVEVIDLTAPPTEAGATTATSSPLAGDLARTSGNGVPEASLSMRFVGTTTAATARLHSVEHGAALVAAVAETVADLHSLGIVHGNLAPSHVLIGGDGYPILCGFSRSRLSAGPAQTAAHDLSLASQSTPGQVLPAPNSASPSTADDVADLGGLIRLFAGTAIEADPIPDRRFRRPAALSFSYRRRALLNLADAATADDPSQRPSARLLAANIRSLLPAGYRVPAPAPLPTGSPIISAPSASDASCMHDPVNDPPAGPSNHLPDSGPSRHPSDALLDRGPPRTAPVPGPRSPDLGRTLIGAALVAGIACFGLAALAARAGEPAGAQATANSVPPLAPEAASPDPSSGGARLQPTDAAHDLGSIPAALPTGPAPTTGPAQTTFPAQRTTDPQTPYPACAGVVVPERPPVPAPGCTRSVAAPGGEIAQAGRVFRIGDPADELLIPDPACGGLPAVILIRARTGDVWVFDAWIASGREQAARRVLSPGQGSHAETGPGPCGGVSIRRPTDPPVRLDAFPAPEEPRR